MNRRYFVNIVLLFVEYIDASYEDFYIAPPAAEECYLFDLSRYFVAY